MQVLSSEGLASHAGPESCADAGNFIREALTGVRAGRVLSREIHAPLRRVLRGADVVEDDGRQHRSWRYRESRSDLARSETPSMYGRTSHGNREIPRSSPIRGEGDRTENPKGARR